MNSFEIRQKFLDFFKKNNHTIIPSSSLIPKNDPSLLFTNAGMNQFKNVFLGKEKRSYKNAASIQKCVRAGGKHNDLDEVGFTNKHLTFFEMMGNFSFGGYFKEQTIKYAWQFLIKTLKLQSKNLVISVYKKDNQSYKIWNEKIKIPPEKIYKLGEKDNFWQMGETGPCGPCSEIHLDYGKNIGCKKSNCNPSCDCGRFIEIWNLVFIEFDRQENGEFLQLKPKGIDTGMGFERLCMIMQKKNTIFQIDTFEILIKKIEELTKVSYKKSNDQIKSAFHVLADHARSTSMLIADGIIPSNEGRGYVLRKIIRRASLFLQKLSDNHKIFEAIANEFILYFGQIYSELKKNKKFILQTIENEVEKFATNLTIGKNVLEKYIKKTLEQNKKTLSGKQIFKLYDTYGFPPEITRVIAKENNLNLDMQGFEKEMNKQKEQSGKKIKSKEFKLEIPEKISTKFVGYEKLEIETKINFINYQNSYIWLITKETPFYVESGGQVSDQGWLIINNHTYPILDFYKVDTTINPAIAVKISIKELNEKIKIGTKIKCVVDYYKRINTQKNHTATHLLQTALIQILGTHVKQAGSYVNDTLLRFDFTNPNSLTKDQIKKIENIVNQKIQEDIELKIFNTTLKKAHQAGVKAFFGEKYNPEKVRVVQISDFSAELCGGTHVKRTGEIGCFKIENELALSSGIRRINAKTGPEAIKLFQQNFKITKNLSEHFKVEISNIINMVQKQTQNLQDALNEIKNLKKKLYSVQIPIWQKEVNLIGKIPFLFLELTDLKSNDAKNIFEKIEKTSPGFYFIISKNTEKPNVINYFAYVSTKWQPQVDLKEFNKFLKEKFEFKGGGNKQMMQGGGILPDKDIKKQIQNWIKIL
ncbi:alanine--tRNA ligase [Candidatus Dependentiae bacterium]|nr:alanine--tRNA ligase [Candidatus Dependentiae bacterium]